MSFPAEKIEIGKCYLTLQGQIRRVIAAECGKVTYHAGQQQALSGQWPRRMVAVRSTFAATIAREVVCPTRYMVGGTAA
jgi:hypothetical protein